jgi:hypothetical protein
MNVSGCGQLAGTQSVVGPLLVVFVVGVVPEEHWSGLPSCS